MQVLLLRHSSAIDPYAALHDEVRWLTDEGRARMRRMADALFEVGLRFTVIYTSPLVRAVQTAEILASASPDFHGPVEVHPELAPDFGTTAQALTPLDHADDDDLVVLVGHEPKIRVLTAHLAGLSHMPGFQPGAACLVEVHGGRGAFQWMMDPRTGERALTPSSVPR